MSGWETLKPILQQIEIANWTTTAISNALDKLAKTNIWTLTKKSSKKDHLAPTDDEYGLLSSIFVLGRAAVDADVRHEFLQDICKLAEILTSAGIFLPESITFLQSMIQRYAKERQEIQQKRAAFSALLGGITTDNQELTTATNMALGLLMPYLSSGDRDKFIRAVKNLPEAFKTESLVPGLEVYNRRLTEVESALAVSDWTASDAHSVITIHSHKGGVGKTTIAISLALQLTKKNRRVCIVDCDEEGPSLHYYLPAVDANQKDIVFFSDWFCSSSPHIIPIGLIQPVANFEKISFIAGSFSGVDITLLDQHLIRIRQRHGRSHVGDRLKHLFKILLTEKGFDTVIVDTSTGIDRLSFDVLMSCIKVKGSRVFVMRPRPLDICQLCLEEDWMVSTPDLPKSFATVVNFAQTQPNGDRAVSIDYSNEQKVAAELQKWKQFEAYTTRYLGPDASLKTLAESSAKRWKEFDPVVIGEDAKLRFGGTLFGPDNSVAEIVGEVTHLMASAEVVLNRLTEKRESRS